MKKVSVLVLVILFTISLSGVAQNRMPHLNFRGERKEFKHVVRFMFNSERATRMAKWFEESKYANALLQKNEEKMLQELDLVK